MDSFAKKYLIGLLVVIVLAGVWWLANRDTRVAEINAQLAADRMLADYPYQFRVVTLSNGVAEMSSPRSAEVPVMRFLRTAFPELANTAVDHPDMMNAQDNLVKHQAYAAKLVKSQPDVNIINWVLDEQWYSRQGVYL